MAAVWILLAVGALLIVLFSLHISADISFSVNEDKESGNIIELRYAFLKFKILPKETKEDEKKKKEKRAGEKQKEKPEKENGKRDIKSLLELLKAVYKDLKDGLFKILGYILTKAVTINELNISADFGLDDPAKTGMATGAAYAGIYNIIGLMDNHMKLKERSVSVHPDFDGEKLKAGVFASLHTNVWHILVIGGIFIKTAVKILFKAWRLKRNEQSGN